MQRFAELEQRLNARRAQPQAPAALPPPPATGTPAAGAPPHVPACARSRRTACRHRRPPPARPRRACRPARLACRDLAVAPPHRLVRVTRRSARQGTDRRRRCGARAHRGHVDTFLPVSFTRGMLLGGLDAPTGGQSQSNPHPVLIRLSDNSVLPNRFRAEYRECFVIAAGYGDISSERAYLRTENLSCVRADGAALEVKIQGSVYGEDGKVGMRGRLVTKQGQMLANALLAGVVSGIGQGISTVDHDLQHLGARTVATRRLPTPTAPAWAPASARRSTGWRSTTSSWPSRRFR